jgi:hypothetical protein
MSFKVDFSGYEVMLPFIWNAKASRPSTSSLIESIKENPVLSGVFEFMKNDYKVSVDVWLNIIHNAFSQSVSKKPRGGGSWGSLSFLNQAYDWCSKNWHLVTASVDWLRSADLEPVVKRQAASYLPRDVTFPDLDIYFVFDACDGRGFKSKVFMDVTLCAILGREKSVGLLAHEYHHSCRADLAMECPNPEWKNTFDILTRLESEGVADKIYDLGSIPPDNDFLPLRQLTRRRKRFYVNASRYLGGIEKGILRNADPRKTFRKSSDHPLGKYMADVIEQNLGKASLVECVGDPLMFLKAYNEAAKKAKAKVESTFVFPETAMAKLEHMR